MWRGLLVDTPDLVGGVAVGDLDGDGLDDLVVKRFSVDWWPESPVIYWVLRSTGTGTTGFGPGGAVTTLEAGPAITSVPDMELADLDGDGHLDLVTSVPQHDRISWWHGEGDGSFTVYGNGPRVDRSAGPAPSQIVVEDVATKPDLLVTNPTAPNAQVTHLANISVGS